MKDDEARLIEHLVQSLQAQLGAAVPATEIRVEVEADLAAYDHAAIRTFVPILVERHVRSRFAHARD
jgi:hypothetical protein